MGQKIHHQRREYAHTTLSRADLDPDPIRQFDAWLREAIEAELLDATAMGLATATRDGQPSLRTVLLKFFDQTGFVFYTNLESRKARQIGDNPHAALLFHWREFERQIKITGRVETVSNAESLKYFLSRPRDSQIGAWVSAQSSVISSRAVLEQKVAEMKQRFSNREIPLPSFWGGYRVIPEQIEFWQGRTNRLHDRFLYSRAGEQWRIERLAP
ncbi:MAG: pyridoxamine 5'-phosphate oxidase [Candidatus Sedimenticola endophacoides]